MTREHAQTSRRGRATYVVLASTGAVALAMAAPELLAAIGVIGKSSLQGWATLVGMWLALPIVAALLATSILTLVGLVRGPRALRMRLLTWWAIGGGGSALSAATARSAGFNPYLGVPQPAFGLSDALLAISFGLDILLPCMWFLRAGSEHDTRLSAPRLDA